MEKRILKLASLSRYSKWPESVFAHCGKENTEICLSWTWNGEKVSEAQENMDVSLKKSRGRPRLAALRISETTERENFH